MSLKIPFGYTSQVALESEFTLTFTKFSNNYYKNFQTRRIRENCAFSANYSIKGLILCKRKSSGQAWLLLKPNEQDMTTGE
jgi:hypothetical protein